MIFKCGIKLLFIIIYLFDRVSIRMFCRIGSIIRCGGSIDKIKSIYICGCLELVCKKEK